MSVDSFLYLLCLKSATDLGLAGEGSVDVGGVGSLFNMGGEVLGGVGSRFIVGGEVLGGVGLVFVERGVLFGVDK